MGGTPDPGGEGGDAPVNQVNDDPVEPSGCACRAAGGGDDQPAGALALLLLGAALALRRGRQR